MCIDVMSWHVGPNEDLFDSPPREFEYTQYRRLKGDLVFQTPVRYLIIKPSERRLSCKQAPWLMADVIFVDLLFISETTATRRR